MKSDFISFLWWVNKLLGVIVEEKKIFLLTKRADSEVAIFDEKYAVILVKDDISDVKKIRAILHDLIHVSSGKLTIAKLVVEKIFGFRDDDVWGKVKTYEDQVNHVEYTVIEKLLDSKTLPEAKQAAAAVCELISNLNGGIPHLKRQIRWALKSEPFLSWLIKQNL